MEWNLYFKTGLVFKKRIKLNNKKIRRQFFFVLFWRNLLTSLFFYIHDNFIRFCILLQRTKTFKLMVYEESLPSLLSHSLSYNTSFLLQ